MGCRRLIGSGLPILPHLPTYAAHSRPGVVATPAELVSFWRSLPHAVANGQLLQLCDGTFFLGGECASLFIRDAYVKMGSQILKMVAEGVRNIVVTGIPGIGKSYFGLYLLWQLAIRGKTVIWQRSRTNNRYKFHGDSVETGELNSFGAELADPSVWCELSGPLLAPPHCGLPP